MFFATIAVLAILGYSLAFIWVIGRGMWKQWHKR